MPPKLGEMVFVRERMQGKVDPKEFESMWLKGVPSHKCARVHNNFKSEHLLLKLKVIAVFGKKCNTLISTGIVCT